MPEARPTCSATAHGPLRSLAGPALFVLFAVLALSPSNTSAAEPVWPGTQTRFYPGIYPRVTGQNLDVSAIESGLNDWWGNVDRDLYREEKNGRRLTHLGIKCTFGAKTIFSSYWYNHATGPYDYENNCSNSAVMQDPNAVVSGQPVYNWSWFDGILALPLIASGECKVIFKFDDQGIVWDHCNWWVTQGMMNADLDHPRKYDWAYARCKMDFLKAFATHYAGDPKIAGFEIEEYAGVENDGWTCSPVVPDQNWQISAENGSSFYPAKAMLEADPTLMIFFIGAAAFCDRYFEGAGTGLGMDDLPGVQGVSVQDVKPFVNTCGEGEPGDDDCPSGAWAQHWLGQQGMLRNDLAVMVHSERNGWRMYATDRRVGAENPWGVTQWPALDAPWDGEQVGGVGSHMMPDPAFWVWYCSGPPRAEGAAADSELGQAGPDPAGVIPAVFYEASLPWCTGAGCASDDGKFADSWHLGNLSRDRFRKAFRMFGPAGTKAMFDLPDGYVGAQLSQLERRVAAGADDAEERLDTGQVFLGSSDLELVRDATNQLVALRFTGVTILPGTVIERAWLELKTDEATSEPTTLLLHGQAADNAPAFVSAAGNISGRTQTAAFTRWTPGAWNTLGKLRRTPDISAVVQEIVDRPGWQNGNALVILIGGNGKRVAEAYDGDPDGAPLLHLEYRPRTFAAYNDLAWYDGQPHTNITAWTRSQAGPMVDYASGSTLGATLTLNNGGGGPQVYGANAQTNTDASDVFGGIVDCAGLIGYGTQDLTLSFGRLDNGLKYELVLFGNRAVTAYADRYTRFTIGGVDAFENASSAGAFFAGPTDPSTVIINGNNTANGYVARFAGIEPGSNAQFAVTVWDDDSAAPPKWYVNALRLKATEPAGSQLLLARQTTWKYEASGADLGTAWRATGYPDTDWPEGVAALGYGTTDIRTGIPYGSDPNDKHMTTYFRKHLFLAGPVPPATRLLLRTRYDDGFVAYLNGQEITRQSMPPGPVDYSTAADMHSSAVYEEIDLSVHLDKLSVGENVLAVEMHQRAPNSSDLAMDMELALLPVEGPIDLAVVERGATWRYRKGSTEASDPATAWRRLSFNDGGWNQGAAPFGYSTEPEEGPFGTELTDMRYLYPSVFLRREFLLEQPLLTGKLVLDAEYDDGFIVWINGRELARPNMNGTPGSFMPCTAQYAPLGSTEPTTWSLTLTGGQLPQLQRTNAIAVQAFNYGLTSSDLVFDLGLTATTYALPADEDLDRDGMPDAWELAWLLSTTPTPDGDPDSDGLVNLEEYIAGTDPNLSYHEAGGVPEGGLFLNVELNAGQVTLSFLTVTATGPGYTDLTRHYALEQRSSLADDSMWNAVPTYEDVLGAGQTVTYSHSPAFEPLLFRVRVWLE